MRNMTIEQINSNIEKRQSMVATVKEKNEMIRLICLGGRMQEPGNERKQNKIY